MSEKKPAGRTNKCCCVNGCKNNGPNTLNRIPPVKWYRFPPDPARRDIWIRFSNRKKTRDGTDWAPTINSRLCSDHFLGYRKHYSPISPGYNPTILPGQKHDMAQLERFNRLIARRENEVYGDKKEPSTEVSPTNGHSNVTAPAVSSRKRKEILIANQPAPIKKKDSGNQSVLPDRPLSEHRGRLLHFFSATSCSTSTVDLIGSDTPYLQTSAIVTTHEASTQVEHDAEEVQKTVSVGYGHQQPASGRSKNVYVGTDKHTIGFFGYETALHSGTLHHITSLRPAAFSSLLALLHDYPARKLKIEDLLLITLFKVRFRIPYSTLGGLFNVSKETIRDNVKKIVEILSTRHENYRQLVKSLRMNDTIQYSDEDDE